MWQLVFYIKFSHLWFSENLMHMCIWLLDFGWDLVVASVFFVLVSCDLTTAESRVKVLRLYNVLSPLWLRLLSVLR